MNNRIVLIFTILLGCQLAGEVITRMLRLPVPGPVLGMVFMIIGLAVRGGVPEDVGGVADGLLQNLSLLFVPAGVGVMVHFKLIMANWFAIVVALLLSAVITIGVTGVVMNWAMRFTHEQDAWGVRHDRDAA